MRRTLKSPADLAGDARSDLKQWLGISQSDEDGLLSSLLIASTELCEAFIGQHPLQVDVVETVPTQPGSHKLRSQPVRSVNGVSAIAQDGSKTAVSADLVAIAIDSRGRAIVEVQDPLVARKLEIEMTVGIARDWASLPHALRHGIIRLAAHNYRERDGELPAPASVTALWQPWRQLRLL